MNPRLFLQSALVLSLAAAPAFATVPPVPEPGTTSLLGAALLAAVLLNRARRRK